MPGDPPEHRVDQAAVARRAAIGADEPNRKIDRGMVGHVEQKDLRGAQKKRGLDPGGVGGSAALEEQAEQMAKRAEPPQHARGERASQRPIALGKCGEARLGILDLLIQWSIAAQDGFEKLGCDATRGEARRLRGGCRHKVMSHETPAGVMRRDAPSAYRHGPPLLPPAFPPALPHGSPAGRGV